jgi:hypothetical protein
VLDGAFSVLIGWVHVHDAADWEVDLSARERLEESLVELVDNNGNEEGVLVSVLYKVLATYEGLIFAFFKSGAVVKSRRKSLR